VRRLIASSPHEVVNLDKLTYAGNLDSLKPVEGNPRYAFVNGDICDATVVEHVFSTHRPDAVMHLAAESHVDRSIDGPAEFLRTNVMGTYEMLNGALAHWRMLPRAGQEKFRFLHISTDEVYGSLGPTGFFVESTPYSPRSPYSASKAASDHLVSAWWHTYGLPVLTTNCSNNYGPFHFPEKLVPLCILNALDGKPLPVYGRGDNVRDWLYVDDHAKALILVLEQGVAGETYNVGGRNERTNLQVVESICAALDGLRPARQPYRDLITFVADRPGHDRRYAIDPTKLSTQLGWKPEEDFDSGIAKTVKWYLENEWWWRPVREKKYAGERLGTGVKNI